MHIVPPESGIRHHITARDDQGWTSYSGRLQQHCRTTLLLHTCLHGNHLVVCLFHSIVGMDAGQSCDQLKAGFSHIPFGLIATVRGLRWGEERFLGHHELVKLLPSTLLNQHVGVLDYNRKCV